MKYKNEFERFMKDKNPTFTLVTYNNDVYAHPRVKEIYEAFIVGIKIGENKSE